MLNLLARLPRHSQYKAALADDDDLARQHSEATDLKEHRPQLTEWSPMREVATDILDALRVLPAVISASAGAKGVNVPKPSKRPETAYERSQEDRKVADYRRTIDAVRRARERARAKQRQEEAADA